MSKATCCGQCKQSRFCDCCAGIEVLTPLPTANRPGLDALRYRVGSHATFLESMKARLSNILLLEDEPSGDGGNGDYPLRSLTTREATDPAIAFLDAWATVGDVLTFYQERIANEGYLRTALERRSLQELARLVGYRPRPGVSASVYLAFLLEESFAGEAEIPAGTRAQSLPGPGELPQPFETAEPLRARTVRNRIRPRLTQPQTVTGTSPAFYIKGTDHNLAANDYILLKGAGEATPTLRQIERVEPERAAGHTQLFLFPVSPTAAMATTTIAATALAPSPAPPPPLMPLPAALSAKSLRDIRSALAQISQQEPDDIQLLLAQFAAALLDAYGALVAAPRSAQREDAVVENIKVLFEIKRLLAKLLEERCSGGEVGRPVLCDLLKQMDVWATNALEILTAAVESPPSPANLVNAISGLLPVLSPPKTTASIPPASPYNLLLNRQTTFGANSDLLLRLAPALLPKTLSTADLYQAFRTLEFPPGATNQTRTFALAAAPGADSVEIYALRATAAPFGHNAQPRAIAEAGQAITYVEWLVTDPLGDHDATSTAPHHTSQVLYLDGEYEIAPDSWVVVDVAGTRSFFQLPAAQIHQTSLAAYGMSSKSTQLTFNTGDQWISITESDGTNGTRLSAIRGVRIYAQSEKLELAEEPIAGLPAAHEAANRIEINNLYEGLEPGRWVIVSGERMIELGGGVTANGVWASELMMLQNVEVHLGTSGEAAYSTLTFANDLNYRYKRETVVVYANVIRATHGETVTEVLGSGDGRLPWQSFTLRKPPLTYLAAPTPAGAASTLELYVNDVRWREADNHVLLGPTDRAYVLETDDEQKTTAIFGNGEQGARLPTGRENVRARYRSAIGRAGNIPAWQIKLLATRPLGVKEVINPLPATGGADRESRDQIRRNAPLGTAALDRLVSVQDYADFARTFAGIGKASATAESDGEQETVSLTIAGADDIPIAPTDDLYNNLRQALYRAGDPWQPFTIRLRELMALVVIARVRLHPDYLWEKVAPQIRAKLYDLFSFERRDLGQDVYASEAISAIQSVAGVVYVDLDVLETIGEADIEDEALLADKLKALTATGQAPGATLRQHIPVEMWQLAYLNPTLPDTLILEEIR